MRTASDTNELRELLDVLATLVPDPPERVSDWHVQRILGGYNNLLYRVTKGSTQLAIKFTRRDERDRAGREYTVLQTLQQLGHTFAPAPVLLDRDRYTLPVVVQTWLEGDVHAAPPETDIMDPRI